jgi:hypothetical protein
LRPFHGWTAAQPTKSLVWYDGYNLTKHDRKTHFDKATLKNCIDAVSANLALFSPRFSPYPLYNEGGTVSALFQQLFEIELKDPRPETFYVPLIKFPDNPNLNLIVIDSANQKLVPTVDRPAISPFSSSGMSANVRPASVPPNDRAGPAEAVPFPSAYSSAAEF